MFRKFLLFLILFPVLIFAQQKTKQSFNIKSDTINKSGFKKLDNQSDSSSAVNDSIPTIDLYKIITFSRDTTYVDTSLTIIADYKANYLRKDIFGLLPFSNEGQTYNVLDFGLTKFNPFPEFGFKAKHFAYMEADDINYYSMATPYTDLFYKSVMEQGQMLDAFISLNTSDRLNFTIAYKGLRSIGKYINALSSNGNFRFITSYNTKNQRYFLRLHFTAQDFSNQENGGIVDNHFFESGEDPYTERQRLDVYFRDAKSLLKGNRYFVDHSFRLNKDNSNAILLNHQFNYEHKFFEFFQPTVSPLFGPSFSSSINNKTRYNKMYNKAGVAYSNQNLGTVEFYMEDFNYNYFYNRVILDASSEVAIPNSLNDRINTYGARYIYNKGRLKGEALFSNSISNQSLANIDISARYNLDDDNRFSFRYQNMNTLPNHNFILHQSDYIFYNWKNNFKNEKVNTFEFEAHTKWVTLSAQYSVLKDHLFFSNDYISSVNPDAIDTLWVSPKQYDRTINYFSVKASREFRFWKFGLDNTLLYQNVTQDDNIINVPQFITRNTFYYSDYIFKKALYFQTGITFQYFTEYFANGYNPLLGEFYVQDREKIGNFPLMDFFINAKIQNFRVFLKAEHFNSSFTGYKYYSAPNYPYRDFIVRFGVIWDFFS